jgi:quercetin dioxygenase-like cupin family protein
MNDQPKGAAGIAPAEALAVAGLVDYAPGAVVSRTVAKNDAGTLTLFAFDAGEGLSEHSAPFDAYVLVLDGAAEVIVGGKAVRAAAGEIVLMPKDVPHALRAPERFKMMLVMLRGA